MSRATLTDVFADGAMSPGKAVEFSGLSRSALYAAMADGSLPYFEKPGRGRLIAKRDLVEYMAMRLKPAVPTSAGVEATA